jgi:hypothetical protein
MSVQTVNRTTPVEQSEADEMECEHCGCEITETHPGEFYAPHTDEPYECEEHKEDCDECDGDGEVTCTECENEPDDVDDCQFCDGEGSIECAGCDGDGSQNGKHEPKR